ELRSGLGRQSRQHDGAAQGGHPSQGSNILDAHWVGSRVNGENATLEYSADARKFSMPETARRIKTA
ncbi:MAG: hypothetical protein J0H09_21910, partial [Burkholderiales bacterium]|nr:hypothetical protein [Burkholderiales bacterium]